MQILQSAICGLKSVKTRGCIFVLPDFYLSSSADFMVLLKCSKINCSWNFPAVGWRDKNGKASEGFLLLPVYETDIYTDSRIFFHWFEFFFFFPPVGSRWQCGKAQLRVLYRSSSSGLDWPKSISAGSALKPEPSAGQQEKCKLYSFFFCSF